MDKHDIQHTVDQGIKSLQGILVDVTCNLASLLAAEEAARPNMLQSTKGTEIRIQREIAQELLGTQERLRRGAVVLFSQPQAEDLTQELMKLTAFVVGVAEDRDQLIEALSEGKSIQQLADISDEVLEKLYQIAKSFYEVKNFEDAADAFSFLCMLNSQKFAFWLGLGNSEFGLKHYDAALFAYAFVSEVDPENYICHLFASRCYEELGDKDNAINSIELALYVVGATSEQKDLEGTLKNKIKQLRGES